MSSSAANESFCISTSTNISSYISKPGTGESPAVLAFLYLAGSLCVLGTIFNVLLSVVVMKFPVLRQGAGLLIAHLLLCDFFVVSVNFPLLLHRITTIMLSSGEIACDVCHYQQAFMVTFNTMINWSEGLLALNRITAILFPSKFRALNRNCIQYVSLLCCWLSALLLTIPPVFDLGANYRLTPIGTCFVAALSAPAIFLFILNEYCPLIIIMMAAVVFIGKFARSRLFRSAVIRPVVASRDPAVLEVVHRSRGMSQSQKHVSRMLITVFGFSLICQLPTYIAVLSGFSVKQPNTGLWLLLLGLVQYAATPVSPCLLCLTQQKQETEKASSTKDSRNHKY